MHDDWLPISDYPIPEFKPDRWFMSGNNVLVWCGAPTIASYSYTQKGRGRWRNWAGIVVPTHWMPLPEGPKN